MPQAGYGTQIFDSGYAGTDSAGDQYGGPGICTYHLTYNRLVTGIPTPNPLDIPVRQTAYTAYANSWQTAYNTYAQASYSGHEVTLPACPPASQNGNLWYSPSEGGSEPVGAQHITWAGQVSDGTSFTPWTALVPQYFPPADVWDFVTLTERSDYPWGGDVSLDTSSRPYVLTINNGWTGKFNIATNGLVSGGYGGTGSTPGKAAYLVSFAEYGDGFDAAEAASVAQIKFWTSTTIGGAETVPPHYHNNNTQVNGPGPNYANVFKQGECDFHAYSGAGAMPNPYPHFGLDFTGVTGTESFEIQIQTNQEYPGDYLASGHPRQLTDPISQTVVKWYPNITPPVGMGVMLSADVHENLHAISMLWVDSSHGLRQAVNPEPDDKTKWQTPIVLETANCSNIGIAYLTNHRLAAAYTLSGAVKILTTDQLGFGAASDWSAIVSPVASPTGWISSGRAQGVSYTLGLSDSGGVSLVQSQDDTGKKWSGVGVASAVSGAGGAFLYDGYGCLYSDASNNIYWTTTDTPLAWGGGGTSVGLSGQIAGLVRLENGILVALSWDSTTTKTRALRSYDRGLTWVKDTSDIASIPALALPPTVVTNQGKAYACWQISNVPASVCSVDGGATWV